MSDFPATVVGPLLSVLRTLPVWVLAGFALAGYAVLFAPALAVSIQPIFGRNGAFGFGLKR
jgi:hypothetical protein